MHTRSRMRARTYTGAHTLAYACTPLRTHLNANVYAHAWHFNANLYAHAWQVAQYEAQIRRMSKCAAIAVAEPPPTIKPYAAVPCRAMPLLCRAMPCCAVLCCGCDGT